ncbi:ArsR/SmtB family transcription factor [Streptomyces sp. NPDC127092]|uniref:ArsR/SmtB family transcription factor n=1 Tax=Streptomyces sp. NPDC127092 TaxID=3347135 RepID=UPI003662B0D1
MMLSGNTVHVADDLACRTAFLRLSRFAVSPLRQVTGTLMPWGLSPRGDFRPGLAQARRSLRRAGLPLLSALALDGAGYLPDFLSPYPTCPAPTVEDELGLVAATDPERVMSEPEFARRGRPSCGLQGIEPSETLRRAMSRGQRHVALQAATELRRYWQLAFAPHWNTVKSLLDAEVDRRASTIVRYGAGPPGHHLRAGDPSLPQPATVSYHLGILRRSGLVSPTRDGRYVLYRRTARGTGLVTDEQNLR